MMTTLAVVDIGSNAIRLHISNLLHDGQKQEFKTLEYMRVPLRLGEDVFKNGFISDDKVGKLSRLAQSLMVLFELYEVDKYLCCATSAMREASNGAELIKHVKQTTGFDIRIIDGDTEAEWANLGLKKFVGDGVWLHIDVGGGSSEVNIYHNKIKIAAKSFRIGAVRILLKEDVSMAQEEMTQWVRIQIQSLAYKGEVISLGTGGNIAKIYELARIKSHLPISMAQIQKQKAIVASLSLEERINKLRLNPDRADVIVPSSEIYTSVMEAAGATLMHVPKVGLTDGMFEVLKNS